MKTNKAGIDLIKSFEGFKHQAYLCPAGVWTIGYGTTQTFGTDPVRPGMTITPDEGELLLQHDLIVFERKVADLVKVKISENAFSALVSLTYNIGVGAFEKSTLLRMLNAGEEHEAVAPQFLEWNKIGKKPINGLTRRREAEMNLFMR